MRIILPSRAIIASSCPSTSRCWAPPVSISAWTARPRSPPSRARRQLTTIEACPPARSCFAAPLFSHQPTPCPPRSEPVRVAAYARACPGCTRCLYFVSFSFPLPHPFFCPARGTCGPAAPLAMTWRSLTAFSTPLPALASARPSCGTFSCPLASCRRSFILLSGLAFPPLRCRSCSTTDAFHAAAA